MSNLSVFQFNSQEIRILSIDGQPWFVAKEICSILDLSNVGQALSRLKEYEKNTVTINDGTPGNPLQAIISESGLYRLVLTSRKPQAEPFQDWVTQEVLPTIRKTGSYGQPQEITRVLPQRDAVDFAEAAYKANALPNGILKQLINDALVDQISLEQNLKYLPVAEKPKQYTIVKVRAKQLGYTDQQIGDGSRLGRFVKSQVEPSFQEMIGRYPVFHYEIGSQLDNAIHKFFN